MMQRGANIAVDAHWEELASMVERRSGLVFAGSRSETFDARVREHMQLRRLGGIADLVRLLRNSGTEYESLLDHLLAAPGGFFRATEAFRAFEQRVLPEMHMKKFWDSPRSLRLWSAGCGSGEEPYSIVLALSETLDVSESWHIHLLATDISRQALQHAERGVYSRAALAGLTTEQVEDHFVRAGEMFMVKPGLRALITFERANLGASAYMGRFDCIFCIDVLDYLAYDRRAHLVQRFFDYLEPGGYLLMRCADRIADLPLEFETIAHGRASIYQKPAAGAGRSFIFDGSMA
jgi:chemotaxis protein methyltransferase CheR